MELYGVGRPAIREALQSLERAGIVVITHGERARIAIPTVGALIDQVASGARPLLYVQPHTLEHLKDARLFLEVGLAKREAENATEDAGARLQARHQQPVDELGRAECRGRVCKNG